MIKLDMPSYCHSCAHFSPVCEGPERATDFFGNEVFISDAIVKCVNQDICAKIYSHLETEVNKELLFTRQFIHDHGLEFALLTAWNNEKEKNNDQT